MIQCNKGSGIMKLIGIVGRVYYNKDNQEIIQLNDYIRRVLSSYDNIVPVMLLPTDNNSYVDINMGNDSVDKEKLNYILDKCDGFIVPGGTYWYNFDEYIIEYAKRNKKPILGICAGFQAMCSMFSKDRTKFDMTKRFESNNHYGKQDEYIHENIIIDNTLLKEIIGKDKIMVNSLHHDYIEFPMNELVISSISSDNIIEAVELPYHPFFVAVQWHPEYLLDNNNKKIFDYFISKVLNNN